MIKHFNLFYFYYHIKFHWILGLGHTQWEKLRASEVRGFPYSHLKMPNYGTGPHTSTHSEWNHHVLLMSNNCVGELATQADGGPPSAAGRGKTPVSCDPPPCPPPMCITAPPAMVVLSPPCLTSGLGGRVQSTESRGTGDHLGNTKTNRIWPPSKIKCLGGLRSLMSTPVTVSELQHHWRPKSCIHCKPIYGAHIQSTVTAIWLLPFYK